MRDIKKRNQVIRKYCPELFEEEADESSDYAHEADGSLVIAVVLPVDEEGQLTDGYVLKPGHVVYQMDKKDVVAHIELLRALPETTDTVVFDCAQINREAGRNMLVECLNALAGSVNSYRGMTQPQIAHALMSKNQAPSPLSGPSEAQSISLEEFFEGNRDDSSIAPNLTGTSHPGIEVFRQTLNFIWEQPGISEVRIGVHEWPYPDEDDVWISAGNVYFWAAGVGCSQLEDWLKPLRPDGVYVLSAERIPRGGPETDQKLTVFGCGWD